MRIPIPFVKEVPEFKPRRNMVAEVGAIDNKALLETLDCLEQKVDFANDIAVTAWNMVLFMAALMIAVMGPQILIVVQGWLHIAHQPAVGMVAYQQASMVKGDAPARQVIAIHSVNVPP